MKKITPQGKELVEMDNISVVEVYIDNNQVGRVALTPDSLCAFEYDSDYINAGLSISPFYLPLQQGLFIAKRTPFSGGFGVFDDSLPDGWGSLVLDRYLRQKGIDASKLNILQRLSLIGSTGRGSLEYRPDKSVMLDKEIVNFDNLAQDCQKILMTDHSEESLDALYKFAGSSGGARPKVFVTIDNRDWLVKFKATIDPDNVGKIEYEYSLLAQKCGIIMPETKLFEGKYFGVERFDRTSEGKIHTISMAGLVNADYRIPSLDYSQILNVCLQLTRDMEEVKKLFRLMVFNVFISNRDDHAKNFSFQVIDRQWKLSPAYDILPSKGFNGYHTTTINNQGEPKLSDIFELAGEIGISPNISKEIVDAIFSVCKSENMMMYTPKL